MDARKTIGTSEASLLFGLSVEETAELQRLSRALPSIDEAVSQRRDARWIELYLKHESAVVRRRLGQGRRSSVAGCGAAAEDAELIDFDRGQTD